MTLPNTKRLEVAIGGGDTARDLNLAKRVALVDRVSGGLRGKRVVDCGCGAGGYTRAYARLGARALGIEYQRSKLLTALSVPERGATFVLGDLTALPIRSGSVDVVVLNEVLEHVPDDATALREIRRVLASTGVLVLLSPNRVYPFEAHGVKHKRSGRSVPVYTPLIPYLPLRVGERVFEYWARNYWPWELRRMVRDAGFEVIEAGFLGQTFENITGQQPRLMTLLSPALRAAVNVAEHLPLASALCSVSQLVVARPRA